LLYKILKIWISISAKIFCRRIIINKPELLKIKGPVLLAANHPNSFLDAVLLDILFDQPIWSLARGDVFKTPFYSGILTRLKILPVYRTSEGVENLSANYETFNACKSIFRNNGLVLMFCEGKCVNEWHLRPLKKGTARLAVSSWKDEIELHILPVGINYSSFRRFGKNIWLNFGSLIKKEDVDMNLSDGLQFLSFNDRLQNELQKLVFEMNKEDKSAREKRLTVKNGIIKKSLLAIPAMAGFVLHLPLYLPLRYFTDSKTQDNDHFDSIIFTLLSLFYPFYLAAFIIIFYFISGTWLSAFLVLLYPFTAWAFVQIKKQLD
jgi:1-acyl-sn-glycerol-3-phosphate acyltransferase